MGVCKGEGFLDVCKDRVCVGLGKGEYLQMGSIWRGNRVASRMCVGRLGCLGRSCVRRG